MNSPRISLCGRLSVIWDGDELEGSIPGRQGRLLFAYLVLNRSRPVRRDELVDALWADEGLPSGGEALLAPPLSRLRKALGPGRLEGRTELGLVLGDEAWIDWETAQASLEKAQGNLAGGDPGSAWNEALEAERIFSGGLLPGLEASWIDEHRIVLEELRLRSLEAVARTGARMGTSEKSKAERAARQAVEASPFRESAREALIEVMRAQGNIAEALRSYEDLRVLLREELGTFPSPQLTALHEQLLNAHANGGPAAASLSGTDPAVGQQPVARGRKPKVPIALRIDPVSGKKKMVGRQPVLDQLAEELKLASGGDLRIALLTGEGGLGKTRLAAEFANRCSETTILYGKCEPSDVRPFGIWIGLLRSALSQTSDEDLRQVVGGDGPTLARLLPELVRRLEVSAPGAPTDVESERQALFGAVLRLIGRMSRERPMLIILDDLHWADRSTLRLLRQLASDDPLRGVLALGMYRDTEVAPGSNLLETVVELRRHRPSITIELEPLDDEEVRELVGDRLDSALASGLREQSGGNPFFIDQLVRHLEEGGDGAIDHVPGGIRDVINQRVARLPEGGAELLGRAALIGQSFDLEILEGTTTASEDRIIDLLDSATAAGLLAESPTVPGQYAFSHALLRSTMEGELSLTRRSTVHRDIGEALEKVNQGRPDRELGELAHHFDLAGPREADRAILYATKAAEQAAGRLAYEEAVSFYSDAIRACRTDKPVDHGQEAHLLLSQADAQWKNGMLKESGGTFFAAADAARSSGLPELLANAALGTIRGGWDAFDTDLAEQLTLFQEALEALPEGDSILRARLMAGYGQMLFYGAGRAAEAHGLAREAQVMVAQFDDTKAEFLVLTDTAFVRWEPFNRSERLPAANHLVALAEGFPEKELLAQALAWRSLAKLNLGQRDAARDDRQLHAEMSITLPQIRVTAGALRAVDCFISGDWEQGERITNEMIDAGIPRAAGLLLEDAFRFMVRTQQGRLGEHLNRLELMGQVITAPWEVWPAWRLGLMLARVQDGQIDQVREELAGQDWVMADGAAQPNASFLAFCGIGNLLTAELGDVDCAQKLITLVEPFAGEWVMIGRIGSTLGPVDLHLGEMQLLVGNEERAVESFEIALATCEEMAAAPFLARTQLGLATALERTGSPDADERIAKLRKSGTGTVTELGMEPWL